MSGAVYCLPAIAGQMGSTSFFQAVMRADELAANVRAAMDFEEFRASLAHEQMQRRLNELRVEQEIVPYLTNHPDRFFGSLIVLAFEPEVFRFISLAELHVGQPRLAAHRTAVRTLGVLEVSGGKLFALDGQHRLHALRTVVNWKFPERHDLDGPFRHDVAKDHLSVIFIKFDSREKARRIFNKVNRYAKPTSASTNILTSEDDGYAIVARVLMGFDSPTTFVSEIESPLRWIVDGPQPLVEMSKDTLTGDNPAFSTVRTIYKITQLICVGTGLKRLDEGKTVVRPSNERLKIAYESCAAWWNALRDHFEPYGDDAVNRASFAERRKADDPWSLAYRPISQEALFDALMIAHQATGLAPRDLVSRLNKMPLRLSATPWVNVLVGTNGKMITKHRALASLLIAYYLVGSKIGSKAYRQLEESYASIHGSTRGLPRPIA